MSTSWKKRKTRLNALLNVGTDEDAQGQALDRILHGQSVIGKTTKTTEVEELRFGDKDVDVVGTLEYGQYGVIDVVTCKLNGKVYVRKSAEKHFALKTQDQCSPQTERDILLRALKTCTPWAPHLLCAFQSPTHLSLVMDYAEGGTLWDVLESSPHDGRILEADMLWWAPQAVSAIRWCHSQNFVHRDIKPHNFVLTADSRLMLIDFGSAAPLLSPCSDGSQQVPKRYCLVPCGTCDYISPEILQSHEEALFALEMADEPELTPSYSDYEPGGYGRETDWWSFGAMMYEMVYGVAPFFANDIRQTYSKIVDYAHSLRFSRQQRISSELLDLLRRLLTTSELRLGRESAQDVIDHPYFDGIDWQTLHEKRKPDGLHVPQFVYAAPMEAPAGMTTVASSSEETMSRAFSFSALFQSSPVAESEPAYSMQQATPTQKTARSILRETAVASFIGFSWGPSIDAFPDEEKPRATSPSDHIIRTPRPLIHSTPIPARTLPNTYATPQRFAYGFTTPVRAGLQTPFQTAGRSTARRRTVSDREAMKQLVNCVGMSARKRVLESGRKPRHPLLAPVPGSSLKELRFDRSVMVVHADSGVSYRVDPSSLSASASASASGSALGSGAASSAASGSGTGLWASMEQDMEALEEESSGATELSYSPTPRPRPGSAPSLLSRSRTPSLSSVGPYLRAGNGSASGSANATASTQAAGPSHQSGRSLLSPALPTAESLPTIGKGEGADVFSAGGEEGLSHGALDALERRHRRLMEDIRGISLRLGQVSMLIGERT